MIAQIQWSAGSSAYFVVLLAAGCGGPNKTQVEKRVRAALPAASAEWKEIKFETRVNDTVYVVRANRNENGESYEYSCTSGSSTDGAGVAVFKVGKGWLAKYRYEKGQEVESRKMESGTDEDVEVLRPMASELALVVAKACR
jgi:hypothetical protein